MKKNIALIVFTAVLLVSCQSKVGYVKIDTVVEKYNKAIETRQEVQTTSNAFIKERDSIYALLQGEINAYQKIQKSKKLSKRALDKRLADLNKKNKAVQNYVKQRQQIVANANQAKIDTLNAEIRSLIKDYGKTKGYSYILSDNVSATVLYGSDSNDITDELLDYLNK